MGVGAGLYVYDVVVKKLTFVVSSPDEFLLKVVYAKLGGLVDENPTVGFRGEAPAAGLGRSPLEAESFFVSDTLHFEANSKEIRKMKKILYKPFA